MRRLQTRVPGSITKDRLDFFLAEWLPHATGMHISKTQLRTLILSGAVYVNRHRNKNATCPLYAGAMVEVYFDEDRMNQNAAGGSRLQEVRFSPERIVFEDEYLIVVDKPTGLPTQPTVDPNRPNLYDLMKKLLRDRDQVAEPYVGLHHRLDKDTSGLVLFTKREEANKGVSILFSEHQIEKTYQCLCWRGPKAPSFQENEIFTVENNLGKVGELSGKALHGAVTSGGDHALTDFKVIAVYRDIYWLQARPRTGRTHQIRVHCSEGGIPILGDELYFPDKVSTFVASPRLMLHAGMLKFAHPMDGRPLLIEATLPDEFVQSLGQLKA